MEALVEATQKEWFPAESVLVMSNRNDAAGLRFAEAHGIETIQVILLQKIIYLRIALLINYLPI